MPRALFLALLWIASLGCQSAAPATTHPARPDKPFLADTYLDLIRTYVVYSESIWHDDPAGAGGFWGDGIDAKNQNGAVRGMCNTLLAHAMLVHALDNGWVTLSPSTSAGGLQPACSPRDELLRYIRSNLTHLI